MNRIRKEVRERAKGLFGGRLAIAERKAGRSTSSIFKDQQDSW